MCLHEGWLGIMMTTTSTKLHCTPVNEELCVSVVCGVAAVRVEQGMGGCLKPRLRWGWLAAENQHQPVSMAAVRAATKSRHACRGSCWRAWRFWCVGERRVGWEEHVGGFGWDMLLPLVLLLACLCLQACISSLLCCHRSGCVHVLHCCCCLLSCCEDTSLHKTIVHFCSSVCRNEAHQRVWVGLGRGQGGRGCASGWVAAGVQQYAVHSAGDVSQQVTRKYIVCDCLLPCCVLLWGVAYMLMSACGGCPSLSHHCLHTTRRHKIKCFCCCKWRPDSARVAGYVK